MCLWESLKIQNMSGDWCFHFTEIGPFWDLVSKKFHNHSVIIHLWWFWRLIYVQICKIHWKFMIFKSQYCFANISTMKAPIFMKFETYIHKIVKNHQMIFRKDPCKHARTRFVNVRARVLPHCRTFYRDFARLQLVRAHLCTKLNEIWYIRSQDSNWPPYKISWRSELPLRRYLQNNTGVF